MNERAERETKEVNDAAAKRKIDEESIDGKTSMRSISLDRLPKQLNALR